MSQVRKMQKGDKIPSAKKYSTFTIDGTAFDVDDNFLTQLTDYGKEIEDERTRNQFSKITDALRSGENLSYNSNSNTLDGNVSFEVTDNQEGRLSKRRSRVGQVLGNAWRGKETQSRHAVDALRGFTYNKPVEQKGTHYDWSRAINMEYGKDGDKRTYINGATNNQAISRIRSLAEIANYTDDDKFTGYGNLDKKAYIDWYNRIGEQGINDLIGRLESGTWTDDDAEMINDIGINVRGQQPNGETYTPEIENPNGSNDTRYGITSEQREQYGITYDSAGNAQLDPTMFQRYGYGTNWQNAYFGENFINRVAAANPGLDWLRDHILYNGKLYNKDQWSDQNSDIYRALSSPDVDIFNRMRQNLFDPNQNDGWQVLWTDNPYQRYNPQTDYNKYFSDTYGNDNNVMYSYTTPLYDNAPEGSNILDIIDQNTQRNEFGLPIGRRSIGFDAEGNPLDLSQYTRNNSVSRDINGDGAINEADQIATGNLFRYMLPTGKYKGWFWDDLMGNDIDGDGNQDYQGWSILQNKETGAQAYYDDANKRIYDPSTDEYDGENIGKQLIEYIRQNGLNGQVQQSLRNMIDRSALARTFIAEGVRGGTNIFNRSRSARWANIPFDRSKLGIPGFQTGGLIGWKSNNSVNSTRDTYVRDNTKTATTDQILSGDLTSADKLQLGALAADLGALIAAIPTGGNPIAAGLGVGGTTAQLVADIKRDGFDMGDLGNAALGYGLDAITFLPGVGIAGKLGKTAQVIKRAKPLLTSLFSGAGITAGLSSLNKDEWTLDDYRNILSGIQGVMGGKRLLDRKVGFKSTKAPVVENTRVSGQKLGDIQRQSIDKMVSESPDKFRDRSWTSTDADGKVKVTDHTAAMNDIDIKNELPTNKFYQESLSKVRAAAENVRGAAGNFIVGKGRRFRTEEELPWFLRNQFGRSWMRGAQSREFGNMVHRMPNREEYEMTYNTKVVDNLKQNNNFIRAWRNSWAGGVREGKQVYVNPRLIGGISGLSQRPPVRQIVEKPQLLLPRADRRRIAMERLNASSNLPSSGSPVLMKKGGIIKAQNGTTINPVFVTAKRNSIGELPSSITFTPRDLDQNAVIQNSMKAHNARMYMNSPEYAAERASLQAEIDAPDRSMVGHPDKKLNLNLNKDMLLGGLDYLISSSAINKAANLQKKGIRAGMVASQEAMPNEFYSRWSDNGMYAGYDARMKSMGTARSVTNDANTAMAENLMREMAVDQIKGERNATLSQMMDQYQGNLLQQKQNYSNMRSQIANRNRARLGEGAMQLAMVDANKTAQQAQNAKSLIYQLRTDLGTDMNRKEQAQRQIDQLGMQAGYQKSIQDFIASKQMDYDVWKNANPELAKTTSLSQWVQENYSGDLANLQYNTYGQFIANQPNRSPRFWLHGNNWAGIDYQLPQLSNPQQTGLGAIPMAYRKRGGTIRNTTGRIRPVEEQHFLDQQKAISKAIGDMNNNVIKLFIKMMS